MLFPLRFGDETKIVTKIKANEFTAIHHEILSQIRYENLNLELPDNTWRSIFLGAGEEKAVFCICDSSHRVFALEVLNEKTYLNGRFVGGDYFFDLTIEGLRNVKLNPEAWIGLTFTGKVKVREFVHGYVWERFQYNPYRINQFDTVLTAYLQGIFRSQFKAYRLHYKDVHERNVMFELRDKRQKGVWVIVKDGLGKVNLMKVGLQPIDIR